MTISADKAVSAAHDRLHGVLPTATDIDVKLSQKAFLTIVLRVDGSGHVFRLKRDAGVWHVREWLKDGKPCETRAQPSPRFESLIASAIGYSPDHSRPHIEVLDMRCPEDPRRLFGKAIVQKGVHQDSNTNLIEFSCSQCKRDTGYVTMHLFDMTGAFVKTEIIEPWIKREPGAWFNQAKSAPRAVA